MCECGVIREGASLGGLYFYDIVKRVLYDGMRPLSAFRELKHELGMRDDVELYKVIKPELSALLRASDEELLGLGLHVERRTTIGMVEAFAQLARDC